MRPLYTAAIRLYAAAVHAAAPFNGKARKMIDGRRNIDDVLREKIVPGARYVWLHAASLGEFEQGRPLLEAIRQHHPDYKIVLTFFSPAATTPAPMSYATSRSTFHAASAVSSTVSAPPSPSLSSTSFG